MPSPTTGLAIIQNAMRLIGVLATGETPSADQTQDGLAALNDILETWSIESLAVYASGVNTFSVVTGQAGYTIGPTGDWVSPNRPIQIDDCYCTFNGVDFPIEIIGQTQYNQIAYKANQSQIVAQLCFYNDFPNAQIFLYPAPAQTGLTVSLNYPRALTALPTAATAFSGPPGYVRALQWSLAAELAPQYGIQLDPLFIKQGISAVASMKRANRTPILSAFDIAITNPPGALWQRGW